MILAQSFSPTCGKFKNARIVNGKKDEHVNDRPGVCSQIQDQSVEVFQTIEGE